jgi:hypothetical protein
MVRRIMWVKVVISGVKWWNVVIKSAPWRVSSCIG